MNLDVVFANLKNAAHNAIHPPHPAPDVERSQQTIRATERLRGN